MTNEQIVMALIGLVVLMGVGLMVQSARVAGWQAHAECNQDERIRLRERVAWLTASRNTLMAMTGATFDGIAYVSDASNRRHWRFPVEVAASIARHQQMPLQDQGESKTRHRLRPGSALATLAEATRAPSN